MKFIRFDEDHFGYLIDRMPDAHKFAHEISERFEEAWPGKMLLIVEADEFVDLTGRYQLVALPEVQK